MIAPAITRHNIEPHRAGLEEATRQTVDFLTAIFAAEDWVCINPTPAKGGPRRWLTLADDEIEDVVEWAWHLNNRAHDKCQPFFGANARKGDGQDAAAGTSHAPCHFADFDGIGPDEALRRIEAAGLPPPTAVIFSGTGTHPWWRLHEPEHYAAEWTHRQKWIAAALGSDEVVCDWPRKMRLPGFANVKDKYAPDYPLSRLVTCDRTRRYSWRDLQPRNAPEPLRPVAATPEQIAAVADLPPGSMSGLTRRFIREGFTLEGGRRKTGYTVACDLAARGWTLEHATSVIHKALSRWLSRGAQPLTRADLDDVPRWVRNAFAAPRTPIIDDAGKPALRVEMLEPDGIELVPLGAYRERIATAVSEAVEMKGVHLNTAGTGCGKTRATAKRVARLARSVTSCPTHTLCEELAEELRSFGAKAAAYPPLDERTCANFAEASKVQTAGLSPGRVICPTCPFHGACAASGYLAGVKVADNSRHKVVTHARLARSAKSVCSLAKCIVLEEEPTTAVRPSIAARGKEMRAVAEFARGVSRELRHDGDVADVDLSKIGFDDPEHELPAGVDDFAAWAPSGESPATESAKETARDVVSGPRRRARALAAAGKHKAAFLRHVADVARYLSLEVRRASRAGPGVYTVELPAKVRPPKNVDAVVWPFLHMSEDPIPPDALRLAVAASAGVLHTLVVQVDANDRYAKAHPDAKPILRSRVVGLWQTRLPYGKVPIIINDGTNDRGTVEALVGREVRDITPAGRVPLQHECIQYAADITLGTRAQQVANIVCGIARAHPDKARLGVILLRPHREELFPDMAAPEGRAPRRKPRRRRRRSVVFPMTIRHRVEWHTHFGSGLDRGSNDMHRQVDMAVVVGTFRPPAHEVRRRLVEMGCVAEAHAGDAWGAIERHGRQPDGTTLVYRGLGYVGEAWRRAAESLTRAAVRQAIGRARANTARGVPVIAITTENTGLPVRRAASLPQSRAGIERVVEAVETLIRIDSQSACAKTAIYIKADLAQVAVRDYADIYAPLSAIRSKVSGASRRTLQRWVTAAVNAGAIVRTGQTTSTRYTLPPPPDRQAAPALPNPGSCHACGCTEHRDTLSTDGQIGKRLCAECGGFIAFTVWHGKPVLPHVPVVSGWPLDTPASMRERGQTMTNDMTAARPMTREEAAAFLGVSPITMACWASKHKGPAFVRTGEVRGRVMYRPQDLAAWLESRSINPSKPIPSPGECS